MARESYRKFIKDGITDKLSPWERLKGQIFFGSEEFIRSLRSKKTENENIEEVPKIQRYADRVSLDDLFYNTADKSVRNKKVMAEYVQYGYKMKEIAEYLSIHYTTVSKIINQVKK